MIKAEWTNADALDLQPTCNQLATDCISRQAAIDALRTCYDTETISMDNGDEYINYEDAVGEIEQLPSAQSELEDKILAIGYTGKEGHIYIGGRLFAVRELAQ